MMNDLEPDYFLEMEFEDRVSGAIQLHEPEFDDYDYDPEDEDNV